MSKEYAIVNIEDAALAARLISIGICPGKVLIIRRKAYFGGAVYISIDGLNFALRKVEFGQIELKQLNSSKSND